MRGQRQIRQQFGLALSAISVACGPAHADPLDEVRAGLMLHNFCVGVHDCTNANKEDGQDIAAEAVFRSPRFLGWAGAPRPHVVVSANTAGETSFAGAGLYWNLPIGRDWAIEPGLGYVVHTGNEDLPFPRGDPRNGPLSRENLYLGSQDLFRVTLALNRDFSDRWGAQLMYEHLSHGQILGRGRNQGLDNIGLRVRLRL